MKKRKDIVLFAYRESSQRISQRRVGAHEGPVTAETTLSVPHEKVVDRRKKVVDGRGGAKGGRDGGKLGEFRSI